MSERVTTERVRELLAADDATDKASAGPCPDDCRGGCALCVASRAAWQAGAAHWRAFAADLLEAREEAARLRAIVDFWQRQHGVAVLVRDGDIAAWKGEAARLRAIVDAVRSAREAVRSTAARYDAAWTGVESVPNAAQAEEIAARLTESYMAGDALSAALDALLSPAADVARDAPGAG